MIWFGIDFGGMKIEVLVFLLIGEELVWRCIVSLLEYDVGLLVIVGLVM